MPRQIVKTNKQMTSAVLSFLLSLFVIISLSNFLQASSPAKKCSNDLAVVVYGPETCAYQYLDKLSKQFLTGSQLIFTTQVDAYVYNFAATYNIYVNLITPIGLNTRYYPDGNKDILGALPASPDIARSYLNFPGFLKDSTSGNAYYYFSFVVFSIDGQMYTVTLKLPLAQAPITC